MSLCLCSIGPCVEPSEVTSTSPRTLLTVCQRRTELRERSAQESAVQLPRIRGGHFRKTQEERRRIPIIPEGKDVSINNIYSIFHACGCSHTLGVWKISDSVVKTTRRHTNTDCTHSRGRPVKAQISDFAWLWEDSGRTLECLWVHSGACSWCSWKTGGLLLWGTSGNLCLVIHWQKTTKPRYSDHTKITYTLKITAKNHRSMNSSWP